MKYYKNDIFVLKKFIKTSKNELKIKIVPPLAFSQLAKTLGGKVGAPFLAYIWKIKTLR